MARRRLTDRTLQTLKPAPSKKRYDVFDLVTPNLAARVNDRGRVTFCYVGRFPGSANPVRRTLGVYGPMTLEKARSLAGEWHDAITKGIDPRTEDRLRRDNTFSRVAEDYITHVKRRGLRKAHVVERDLRKEFIRRWAKRPIDSIAARDVIAVLDDALARGAPYRAHGLFATIRPLFNWAVSRDFIDRSPCDKIKPKEMIGVREPRQRVLTDTELFAFWRAAGRLGYPFGPMYRLLLLTGARRDEIAGARWRELHPELVRLIKGHRPTVWSDVPDDIKLMTIPPERFKSNATHLIPLTDDACAIIANLPTFTSGDYLFSGTLGKTAVSGFSKSKRRLDERITLTLKALARRNGDDPSTVTLPPFVTHDLRRTMRTRLSSLRIPTEVAELVIGHGKKGLARVYDQHQFLDEMREAVTEWAAKVRGIVR